jgi:drug/metabolite transporter (DMT)-like permease
VTAFLFWLSLLAQQKNLLSLTPRAWMCIAGLVVLPTILGHALFTYLLKFMNINIMSCAKLIEPAMAAFTAYFIFSEAMSFNTFIAFLLTSVSVLILFFPKLRKTLRLATK